jgi:hypothetical protein
MPCSTAGTQHVQYCGNHQGVVVRAHGCLHCGNQVIEWVVTVAGVSTAVATDSASIGSTMVGILPPYVCGHKDLPGPWCVLLAYLTLR